MQYIKNKGEKVKIHYFLIILLLPMLLRLLMCIVFVW